MADHVDVSVVGHNANDNGEQNTTSNVDHNTTGSAEQGTTGDIGSDAGGDISPNTTLTNATLRDPPRTMNQHDTPPPADWARYPDTGYPPREQANTDANESDLESEDSHMSDDEIVQQDFVTNDRGALMGWLELHGFRHNARARLGTTTELCRKIRNSGNRFEFVRRDHLLEKAVRRNLVTEAQGKNLRVARLAELLQTRRLARKRRKAEILQKRKEKEEAARYAHEGRCTIYCAEASIIGLKGPVNIYKANNNDKTRCVTHDGEGLRPSYVGLEVVVKDTEKDDLTHKLHINMKWEAINELDKLPYKLQVAAGADKNLQIVNQNAKGSKILSIWTDEQGPYDMPEPVRESGYHLNSLQVHHAAYGVGYVEEELLEEVWQHMRGKEELSTKAVVLRKQLQDESRYMDSLRNDKEEDELLGSEPLRKCIAYRMDQGFRFMNPISRTWTKEQVDKQKHSREDEDKEIVQEGCALSYHDFLRHMFRYENMAEVALSKRLNDDIEDYLTTGEEPDQVDTLEVIQQVMEERLLLAKLEKDDPNITVTQKRFMIAKHRIEEKTKYFQPPRLEEEAQRPHGRPRIPADADLFSYLWNFTEPWYVPPKPRDIGNEAGTSTGATQPTATETQAGPSIQATQQDPIFSSYRSPSTGNASNSSSSDDSD